jgi:hypothetical protein
VADKPREEYRRLPVPRDRGFDWLIQACFQGVVGLVYSDQLNTSVIIRPQHREGRISAQMQEGDSRKTRRYFGAGRSPWPYRNIRTANRPNRRGLR